MTDPFPIDADFNAPSAGGEIDPADIEHQAFVEVDEGGTEAAAATGARGDDDGGAPVIVDVNRAFFFFIRDVASNAIRFVGRESDPAAQ